MSGGELPFRYNVVDGLVVTPLITQRRVDEIKQLLTLSACDVVIASYHKSGTTWVQYIVKLLRNDGKEDGRIIPDLIPWLEFDPPFAESANDAPNWRILENLSRPIYLKSHMPYELCLGVPPHTTEAKYVYIARNPKDVAVSFFHHMRAFQIYEFSGSWDDFFHLYLSGRTPFGSWFDHVLGWWKHREASNLLFLKYEDLCSDLRKEVRKIASFLFGDIPPPNVLDAVVQQCSFDSMKANPSANFSLTDKFRHAHEQPFMRKGKVGDWKNYFSAEQNAAFDDLYAERMKDTGLEFDF